jgi:hypothetical protein
MGIENKDIEIMGSNTAKIIRPIGHENFKKIDRNKKQLTSIFKLIKPETKEKINSIINYDTNAYKEIKKRRSYENTRHPVFFNFYYKKIFKNGNRIYFYIFIIDMHICHINNAYKKIFK